MELRHLRYFIAVAETLHFGRAAAELHIAQPSLSQQIRQLETELGATLLTRARRRVALTDAGRLFLHEARDIIGRSERAAVIARRVGEGELGPLLRVGVGYCMNQTAISESVSRFNQKFTHVRIEVQTLSVPAQIEALKHLQIDVGFIRPPIGQQSLDHFRLVREPLVLATPLSHRFAGRGRVPLSACAKEAFILVPRDVVPVYHDTVVKACREAGFVPRAPHEADYLQMVLGMVATGSGIALVPAFAQGLKLPRLWFARLRGSPVLLETAIAWRRDDVSPVIKEFVAIARHVLSRTPVPE